MTLHIPLRLLLFIGYTATVLVCAFALSYAVFEWRIAEAGRIDDLEVGVSSVQNDLGEIDGRISSLDSRTASGSLLNNQYELRSRSEECHAGLVELILLIASAENGQISGFPLQTQSQEIVDRIGPNC